MSRRRRRYYQVRTAVRVAVCCAGVLGAISLGVWFPWAVVS